jgi:putative ATPase
MDTEAVDHLINVANGDARALLNALELAVETTPSNEAGIIQITLAVAEESIQQRAVLYDKEGDVHFDTISALIKSVRGSDPDAALYWLARMVYAGEDPRFIFRRLLILASEDVGLATPDAIAVVNACAAAFDRVGMPEGRYPLAQATLYLATAPKSNSVMGFFDALAAVEREREAEVPNHLRDPSRDKQSFGHGAGYLYPHSYREHWVAQQYLPSNLQGRIFYQPSEQGYEDRIRQQVSRQREAQLTAMVEGFGVALPEVLTFSPTDSTLDRWLQRSLSQTGVRLGQIRDRLFSIAQLQRHHVVLDVNAGSGLLTWEALRQVPEGGVYATVFDSKNRAALEEQALLLPEVHRPIVLQSTLVELVASLQAHLPQLKFDRLIGRNVLTGSGFARANLPSRQIISEQVGLLQQWLELLHSNGKIVLAETLPQQTQRLYRLIEPNALGDRTYRRVEQAEEAIYADPNNSLVNWDINNLVNIGKHLNLNIKIQTELIQTEMQITAAMLDRWFSPGQERPSYRDYLVEELTKPELTKVQFAFRSLLNRTVQWQGGVGFLEISRSQ